MTVGPFSAHGDEQPPRPALTPAVGQVANLPAWMHNKRTFEIVCQSLKTTGLR